MPGEPGKYWDLIARHSFPSVKRWLKVTVIIVSFSKLMELFPEHAQCCKHQMHFLSGLSALTRRASPEPPISSYLGNTESPNIVLLLLCIDCGKAWSQHEIPSGNVEDSMAWPWGARLIWTPPCLSLCPDAINHVLIHALVDHVSWLKFFLNEAGGPQRE